MPIGRPQPIHNGTGEGRSPPQSMHRTRIYGVVAKVLLASFVAVLLVAITSRRVRTGSTIELVPAYFYPEGDGLAAWKQLIIDAQSINIEVILNPASGPGTTQDPSYVAVVNNLRSAGGGVFGYVSTQYGNRDITAVMEDVNTYVRFYRISGIFVDEMANTLEKFPYYEKLYHSIKKLDSDFKVVGNPGMPYTVENYLGAADTLVIFEGTGAAYAHFKPFITAPWVANHPPNRFANIVYALKSTAELHRAFVAARRTNAGSVFITDGGLPNPYAGLPHYWVQQVAALRAPVLTESTSARGRSDDQSSGDRMGIPRHDQTK
jgi:hypothetical protein